MTLRTQLFLVSLLTLVLPWASCQYVREMEDVQRQTQRNALLATAQTITTTLPNELRIDPLLLSAKRDPQKELYAYEISGPVVLDGFADDWHLTPEHRRVYKPIIKQDQFQVSALTAKDSNYFYLHLSVKDKHVVYPNRQGSLGDQVIVVTLDNKLFRNTYTLSTTAPGPVSVAITGENPDGKSLTGFWHETVDGYNVELKIPINDIAIRFGFLVRDVDAPEENAFVLGSLSPTGATYRKGFDPLPGILRFRNSKLEKHLQQFARSNLVMRVIDDSNWEIATIGSLDGRPGAAANGFLANLYRRVLKRGTDLKPVETPPAFIRAPHTQNALAGRPASLWTNADQRDLALVSAAYPIKNETVVIGALVLEQASSDILLLSDADSAGFISRSLLLTLGVATVLLGYASYLSVRVRRLRNAAEQAVSLEGQLKGNFPISKTGDEIGDLSRSFSTLLQRVQEYTDYLENLAGRLSHELRTPLTVVRSSLDNLISENLDDDARKYTNRARDGVQRLGHLLTAMSEANRLEQSIRDHDIAEFDIVGLLEENTGAFADIYPEHHFDLTLGETDYTCKGSPELISQLLDKLVNNAVDFADSRKEVGLELQTKDSWYSISVWNYGKPLPSTMIGRLFDPMVSLRSAKGKTTHLGLGLHIAKMIAQFHGGNITATNLEQEQGTKFVVTLSRHGPTTSHP